MLVRHVAWTSVNERRQTTKDRGNKQDTLHGRKKLVRKGKVMILFEQGVFGLLLWFGLYPIGAKVSISKDWNEQCQCAMHTCATHQSCALKCNLSITLPYSLNFYTPSIHVYSYQYCHYDQDRLQCSISIHSGVS